MHVVAPVVWRWIALQQILERARDRLDRPQRVAELMADDADQPLPRLAFLLAQRPAHIRQHEQIMRQPAEPERRPSDFPSAGPAAGGRDVDHARCIAKPFTQRQLLRGPAEHVLHALAHQSLAGAVDDAQAMFGIESEDGHVDLFHDRAQERRGFDGTEPLFVQGFCERVDLNQRGAERIVRVRGAAANREVVFAQGGEQVGQGLQRYDDASSDRSGESEQRAEDDDRQRPLDLRRVRFSPEDPKRGERAGKSRADGER